jgi:biopolymer transport protein ExbB
VRKDKVDNAQLEKQLKALDNRLAEKKKVLAERHEPFAAVYDVARQAAVDMEKLLADSLISAEHTGRAKKLRELSSTESEPSIDRVGDLWLTLLQEMKSQSEVKAFEAPVVAADGIERRSKLMRIGPFSAVHNGKFLEYVVEQETFRVLGRQPGGKFLDAARNLKDATESGDIAVAIDPSRGSILALLVQTPSLQERIHQGGLVGYIIIGLATFGVLLALIRIVMLRITAGRVARQKQQLNDLHSNNPLGRVLLSVAHLKLADVENIERRLDESILKELPALEWGLPVIKLLAAVAPLLGLLGTVVGMILTFQAISLFGSGDPKLMAGGISQALVTTVLGLVTAIPLLLLHSLAQGMSRRVEQTLDEQSAALVAERLERTESVTAC